jgi:NADH:ubiquinone oxidoreductase subunit 5 (subunit L)/multisubunit Na+/H+ antiporter MnhA subunit
VLYATGERDLDRLGGLGRGMPWTAGAFGMAAMGAAALPVSAGFVAEWTLLQSLIHGARPGDTVLAVLMPAAVAVIALTTGLALLTFVKAYGIGFLARSRTPEAEAGVEVPWTMRGATVVGAVAVVALGLVPGPLSSVLADSLGVGGVATVGVGGLDLSGLGALLDPAALAVLALAMAVPVLVGSAVLARKHPARRTDLAWGCGGARVSPRMQYTATSYAEPLVRVFDDALRPSRDLEVTHLEESQYLVQQIEFRQRVDDVVELRTYRPLVRRLDALAERARGLQNGSIHRYLGYSFVALVVVLLAVTL